MKGYRFYEEFSHKRKGISAGNVVAIDVDARYASGGIVGYYSIGSVFDWPNSDVAGTFTSCDYLRTKCKRVSETHARDVHPKLFLRISYDLEPGRGP